MDGLTLTFNVLGLIFGSGALIILWQGGKRVGEVEIRLRSLEDEASGVTVAEVDKNIALAKEALVEDLHVVQNNLNARIDDLTSTVSEAQHDIGSGTEAIRAIRRDWEGLNSELRHLLRSEAAGTTDIIALKERMMTLETKVTQLGEKVAALGARFERGR